MREARHGIEDIRTAAESGWRELQFNASFQDRLPDVGILLPEDVVRLGTVGPAARAAGVAVDARSNAAGLDYPEFEVQTPDRPTGDVRARTEQRMLELRQAFDLLDRLLDGPVRPVAASRVGAGSAVGVGLVESARGSTLCVVERERDVIGRVRLRTGSYANWPSVAFAGVDNLLPDFPLINKSFELCYACADR